MVPAFAQKDKKRKTSGTTTPSTRLMEAEASYVEGEKYFILEDYTKALYYFNRSLELNAGASNGDVAAIHYKMAEILSKGNKPEDLQKAVQSIRLALSLDKKNKYYYILASTIYSSMNNFGEAEEMLESMMREIKGNEEYLYDLAALYQYDHKPEEAIKAYNRAEEILGVNEVSALQKQRLYFESGKVTEAIAEGQKFLDSNPDDDHTYLAYAETLSQFRQGPRAILALENFLKDHPGNGRIKLMLAELYREAGQEQKFRELSLSVFDDPEVPLNDKITLLGNQLVILGKEKEKAEKPATGADDENFAIRLFEKLVKSDPHESNVHATGGDLYMMLRKNDEAEREYSTAIRLGSTTFEAFQNLVSLELQANKFDSIIVHTEAGLELFPNQAILYYFNGYAQLRKKHYREAVTSLEQAKKLSAANAGTAGDINGMLGDAYNGLKDYVRSDNAYEEALLQNPDNDLILNNYSYFLAERRENLEKAEKMTTQLIKNNPGNGTYLDTYGWVLYMRGKYKEAKKALEKAIASGTASAVFYDHYGDILFQLGDTDNAVKQWQKAKALDSSNPGLERKINNRKL